MARTIVWTEVAWVDLEAIANYIFKDSPTYSAACVREIRDAARSLAQFAERGRVVPELDDTNIRDLLVRNYRLIYRVTKETVYIVGFMHGARDLRLLLERGGRIPEENQE